MNPSRKSPHTDEIRRIFDEISAQHLAYWREHPEEQDHEHACPVCGSMHAGYPVLWWSFPTALLSQKTERLGVLPDRACPHCYGQFRVQTEIWGKSPQETLIQLLKDRNWRLWLEELSTTGYNASQLKDDERRAYVIQLYIRGGVPGDTTVPSKEFFAVPIYRVAIPDALSDPFGFEEANIERIIRGYDFAETIIGSDALREYLRLGPEAWHAQQDEGVLTVELAAQKLGLSIKTTYEYCSNFFAYDEYGPLTEFNEEEEGTSTEEKKKRRTSVRKLYHRRTRQGEIRIPLWAIDLFQMQYGKGELRPLTSTRDDVRFLLGDRQPYHQWHGSQERITWLPRFEFQDRGGHSHWSRVLVDIDIYEGPSRSIQGAFTQDYLDAHPCPAEEAWLIEDIKKAGGPVAYDESPDEYWTFRSRMEWARLQRSST